MEMTYFRSLKAAWAPRLLDETTNGNKWKMSAHIHYDKIVSKFVVFKINIDEVNYLDDITKLSKFY
jgi:hypothetical protein